MAPASRSRRHAFAAGLLLLSSLAVALALCEVGARFVLNPADYLSASTEGDDVLGIRIAPGPPGFDGWGFRNRAVRPSAEIVGIGDSHTYGNNAPMAESWPAVVGRLTGRDIYNLGLGGYGPNQHYHLLVTRGLGRCYLTGRFSGVHDWPVLGVHRGSKSNWRWSGRAAFGGTSSPPRHVRSCRGCCGICSGTARPPRGPVQ